jgi:hypothetical protein
MSWEIDTSAPYAFGRFLFCRGEVVGVEVRCPFCDALHAHAAFANGSFGKTSFREPPCKRGRAYELTIGHDPRGLDFGMQFRTRRDR